MKITDPEVQFVIRKTYYDGIGNVMKGFITAFSVNPNTKVECNQTYKLGVYDTVLDSQHIFDTNTDCRIFYMYTSRLLVLADEEDVQEHIKNYENRDGSIGHISGCPDYNYLFSPNRLIDKNYDPTRISNVVKKRILSTIYNIQFLPIIYENVNSILLGLGRNTLGVSIRTWNCFHEANIRRVYNPYVYIDKIKEVLELHPEIDNLVISFDNHNYEREYIDFLNNLEIPVKILRKSENLNELQFAFIKMLTLSKSKYYIGQRNSAFSELVWWFSDCLAKCYNVF